MNFPRVKREKEVGEWDLEMKSSITQTYTDTHSLILTHTHSYEWCMQIANLHTRNKNPKKGRKKIFIINNKNDDDDDERIAM